jgi:hypothetical protein
MIPGGLEAAVGVLPELRTRAGVVVVGGGRTADGCVG